MFVFSLGAKRPHPVKVWLRWWAALKIRNMKAELDLQMANPAAWVHYNHNDRSLF